MLNEEQIIEELLLLNSSIVHDALRSEKLLNQTLPHEIKPLLYENKVVGKVWTLSGELKSELNQDKTLLSWTNFLSNAEKNSVIVCQPNNHSIALMGELSAEVLKLKGIRGYITDGGCRDVTRIKSEIKLPIYCRYNTPKDVAGRWIVKEMGTSIQIGDVNIKTGDYLIADEDGIVIIPNKIIFKIIAKAKKDLNSENKMRKAILNGTDPQEAYLKYGKF
ncbi:MAG: RraA family protein [Alphaproteobacteria bacterium]|mgnify:FL=1|nr:RraA family protein [Alphaproteobacteria bacterium]